MASHSLVSFSDSLQYADGDVIIQTSKDPSGTLVVHSHVLSQGSDYFRAMFNRCGWSKSTTLHTVEGKKKTIWNLQMFFDRESKFFCLLTDRVCYVRIEDAIFMVLTLCNLRESLTTLISSSHTWSSRRRTDSTRHHSGISAIGRSLSTAPAPSSLERTFCSTNSNQPAT